MLQHLPADHDGNVDLVGRVAVVAGKLPLLGPEGQVRLGDQGLQHLPAGSDAARGVQGGPPEEVLVVRVGLFLEEVIHRLGVPPEHRVYELSPALFLQLRLDGSVLELAVRVADLQSARLGAVGGPPDGFGGHEEGDAEGAVALAPAMCARRVGGRTHAPQRVVVRALAIPGGGQVVGIHRGDRPVPRRQVLRPHGVGRVFAHRARPALARLPRLLHFLEEAIGSICHAAWVLARQHLPRRQRISLREVHQLVEGLPRGVQEDDPRGHAHVRAGNALDKVHGVAADDCAGPFVDEHGVFALPVVARAVARRLMANHLNLMDESSFEVLGEVLGGRVGRS
mmetsp:Transcript_23101/g.61043  ORF Transcript_23101/g.61043 Transcript_23101/m.61043 type:complete len:339 (-) Transcript_23101:67-1083(-)